MGAASVAGIAADLLSQAADAYRSTIVALAKARKEQDKATSADDIMAGELLIAEAHIACGEAARVWLKAKRESDIALAATKGR